MTDLHDYRDRLNRLSHEIIGAALDVHREVGPGMLESAYEACLAFELSRRGLAFEQQKPLPLAYKGIRLACGFRLDFLVEKVSSKSRRSGTSRGFTDRSFVTT